MLLRAVGPCSGEPTFQHAQMADLVDIELFPPMRRSAATFATDLEAEQTLDATSKAVVVRFDKSDLSDSVDEFDHTLVDNRPNEIVIHCLTILRQRLGSDGQAVTQGSLA